MVLFSFLIFFDFLLISLDEVYIWNLFLLSIFGLIAFLMYLALFEFLICFPKLLAPYFKTFIYAGWSEPQELLGGRPFMTLFLTSDTFEGLGLVPDFFFSADELLKSVTILSSSVTL